MTAKQKANRERFKKVVAEAKKIRAKNPKLTQGQAVAKAWAILYAKAGKKKVGATKIVQKGQSKNAKVTKVLQQTRTKKGQFKGYKRIAGERHTDTKSHNVNIRVVSGIGNIGSKFTRINNDVNGNPRYVIHFLELLNDEEKITLPWNVKYDYAVKKANKIGGKKFHNKQYGGGIVFQSYNLDDTWKAIQKIKEQPIKYKF